MTVEFVIYWGQQSLRTVILVTGPVLLGGMFAGILVGLFQTITSINEMTLTFIPKIAVVIIILLFLMPWMLNTIIDFTTNVFAQIAIIAN